MYKRIYLTEELIQQYSKKIFGFALNKTKDINQAEELSQEIFLNLVGALKEGKEIIAMDQYVYTLCYYTWSKYVRKNIKSWRDESIDQCLELKDDQNIEDDYILQEDLQRLRQEIAYLAKIQREITIAFYYENKSSQVIAEQLGIKDSTVRWHLSEVRRKLREGIEMENRELSYHPSELDIRHEGWILDENMYGLKKDLLCQNIVLACYESALTVEEIGRKLGVAAAYLEYHIERLLFMDYLKIVGKNKYRTNFWIDTVEDREKRAKFQYELISEIANYIFESLKSQIESIRKIGFIGCDLEEDELLWDLIGYYTYKTYASFIEGLMKENNISRPKRKDGTDHWVIATLLSNKVDKYTYTEKIAGYGVKTCEKQLINERTIYGLQLDNMKRRDFDTEELIEIARVREIIINEIEPNEYDKLLIARLVQLGYVAIENQKVKIKVPFLVA
ncbi:MAG: RNA polymerase sigma factor, partial [Cellulosilyticaceae bacterium]